ncbi:type II toxin-antitoxin system RelE/ParE family toxin [Cupriavidus sp. WGtm5]|uniref:type II toxin-antitoxin system RelE/ParE family toxin n=1 Tax=Cupriavidus sp. WGtm5 TaxID=2919926 RepID=UPI002090BC36|nr:type II toxin-antitoxin system RelE/ParE family toxin [Cupriavidus sp. WGtm5]MCO4892837.1 type II toxin-antitoxin system RelE/ParE family toxin [Cupriavidus sp. WGtm5]
MRTYPVVFAPEFVEQLEDLYDYVAEAASPYIAARYTDAIVEYCESLSTFPHRGTLRDDVRPWLRITHYKKRAVIAFAVDTDKVSIIGLFYGGRDYETMLNESD